MLKIATSYFYQIRFFKPYMIPMSTTMWDPKWYHNFKDQSIAFVDKNGVLNGMRIPVLVPDAERVWHGTCYGRDKCSIGDPTICEFLRGYRRQLDEVNFDAFMQALESTVKNTAKLVNITEEPLVVFMFAEKPDNPCSERVEVHQWFHRNGFLIDELNYPVEDFY